MSKNILILAFVISIASVNQTFSQIPTLDPIKTVNVATGEMGFVLPLDVVKGIDGYVFPINLNYQAGIKLNQTASPVGLGFDISAGTITRKTVFVSDHNSGGQEKYVVSNLDNDCDPDFWVKVVRIAIYVVFSFLGTLTGGAGFFVGVYMGLVLTFAGSAFNILIASPADYIGGGRHVPTYNYKAENGAGFLKGGSASDLPDIYFVNTPLISGQIQITGNGYKFITPGAQSQNVKVEYQNSNNVFLLTLPDGTRMRFGKNDITESHSIISGNGRANNSDCSYGTKIDQNEGAINQWYLTEILYPNFTSIDDVPNLDATGAWIQFEYDEIFSDLTESPKSGSGEVYQISNRESGIQETIYKKTCFLKRIVTPNENAEISYIYDRLDYAPSVFEVDPENIFKRYMVPYLTPRIDDIKIISNNKIRKKINFQTDYLLRPKTTGSRSVVNDLPIGYIKLPFVEPALSHYTFKDGQSVKSNDIVRPNPQNASLTLLSISISCNNQVLPPIIFDYSGTENPALTRIIGSVRDGSDCCKSVCAIEEKDIWGYYKPVNQTKNDFNIEGEFNKATRPDGSAYADAWSISGITLPTGKKIEWLYEPQRYLTANGVAAKKNVQNETVTKYGGGIRVKTIRETDISSKKCNTFSYFYTNTKGNFIENEFNSSGSATCEPFPYTEVADENEDPRPALTRGGLYTPAQIAYNTIQVVKNYNPTGNNTLPQGYSVYEYYTSCDYPNTGAYGDIDMSWKRGFIKSFRQYNSSGKIISEIIPSYRWVPEENSAFSIRLKDASSGWVSTGRVEVVKESEVTEGVKKEGQNYYSTDDNLGNEQDLEKYTTQVSYAGSRIPIIPGEAYSALAKTTNFGNIDKDDIVIAYLHDYNGADHDVNIAIVKDVDYGVDVNSNNIATKTLLKIHSINYYTLLGVDVCLWDDNSNPDILVQTCTGNTVFWNILLNPDIVNGTITGQIKEIKVKFNLDTRGRCATICDINNNGKVDIICGIKVGDSPDLNLFCFVDANDDNPQSRMFYGAKIENAGSITHLTPVSNNSILTSFPNDDGHFIQGDIYYNLVIYNNALAFKNGYNWYRNICNSPKIKALAIHYVEQARATLYEDGWQYGGALYDGKTILAGVKNGYTVAKVINGDVIKDLDRQPNMSAQKTNRSSYIISVNTPAFFENEQFKDNHMLVQNYRNTIWEIPDNSKLPVKTENWNGNVINASVTKWQLFDKTWLPKTNYFWNTKLDKNGLPSSGAVFIPFDFSDGASNPLWKKGSSIEKYDQKKHPIESVNLNSNSQKTVHSAIIYGHKRHLPIASISNSKSGECAVYTCNYDLNEDGYFDKENGWEKGGATIEKDFDPRIYGAAILVNGTFGPTKNIYGVDPNKDYIFSAYVFPTSTVPMRFTVEPHKDNSENPSSSNSDGQINGLSVNKWQLVTKKITGKMLKDWGFDGSNDYLRIWIGNYPGDTKSRFYLNDIRFHPANALVTTTYYRSIDNQPVGTIDENNKPGLRIGYDNFGRPETWEKLDLTKSPNENGYATTVKSMQYHMYYELLPDEKIRLISPNGGETFVAGENANVSWVSASNNTEIYYKNETEQGWNTIIDNIPETGPYVWQIPQGIHGNYRIKVKNVTESVSSISETPFFIMPTKYGTLQNIAPANGSSQGKNIRLIWQGSGFTSGNISYRVWIGPNKFDMIYFDTENTFLDVGASSSRIWYVEPYKDGIGGTIGPIWEFSAGDAY